MPAEPGAAAPAAFPFRPRTPVVIGLLGGVAAGKSTVAAMFAAHGLEHVDADRHAREVSAEPAVVAQVAAALGADVVSGGQLDRQAVAARVFADTTARRRLEAVLHPRIRARILAELEAHAQAGRSVLLDAPLLLEGGLIDWCDHVVFLDAPLAVRQARAKARGWEPGELERREAAQAPLAEKERRSGFRIRTGGDLQETRAEVDALLRSLAAATT